MKTAGKRSKQSRRGFPRRPALSSLCLLPPSLSPRLYDQPPATFPREVSLLTYAPQLYNVLDGQRGRINSDPSDPVLLLSRGTAIVLLITYFSYLIFQLVTHPKQFNSAKEAAKEIGNNAGSDGAARSATSGVGEENNEENNDNSNSDSDNNNDMDVEAQRSAPQPKVEVEAQEPCISAISAAIVLVVTTVVIGVCADYLVGSIDDVVEEAGISKTFIGLILIPIVGNAAEHVTAIVVAMKDKMDLAMGVAIGSSIQIATLVTPFMVIFGWIIHEPMSLHFETCEF